MKTNTPRVILEKDTHPHTIEALLDIAAASLNDSLAAWN